MQSSELDRRLQIVREIAVAAGEVVLQFYYEKVQVEWKSAGNPVTAADRAANETILTQLRRQFSGEPVLSEESQDDMSRLGRDVMWVVDPLDGTKEFIKRNGEFSVMIGMVENGRPVLGVVCQPAASKTYFGAIGLGAWLASPAGTKTLHVSDIDETKRWRMVASRSHFDPRVDRVRQRLGIHEIRHSGSVGLKCGLIAAGECEIYIHPSSKVNMWDSCGPAAILSAAGGVMTDMRGESLSYSAVDVRHRNGLAATSGRLHEQAIQAIRDEHVTTD
jgi:3'(2'), 5'-bisphosphate nucleotidase